MLDEDLQRYTHIFLFLAYPTTFLFFQGGQYCEPLCFEPTPFALFELVIVLLVLMVVSAVATRVFRLGSPELTQKAVCRPLSPAPPTSIILLGVYALFVVFLTLDAISLYEAIWKPLILPLSLLLYFPVWIVYMASFPIAMLFSVFGIDSSAIITLVFRGIVIFVGFPLSVLFQSVSISAINKGFNYNK